METGGPTSCQAEQVVVRVERPQWQAWLTGSWQAGQASGWQARGHAWPQFHFLSHLLSHCWHAPSALRAEMPRSVPHSVREGGREKGRGREGRGGEGTEGAKGGGRIEIIKDY